MHHRAGRMRTTKEWRRRVIWRKWPQGRPPRMLQEARVERPRFRGSWVGWDRGREGLGRGVRLPHHTTYNTLHTTQYTPRFVHTVVAASGINHTIPSITERPGHTELHDCSTINRWGDVDVVWCHDETLIIEKSHLSAQVGGQKLNWIVLNFGGKTITAHFIEGITGANEERALSL